jgi:hypothetical protein
MLALELQIFVASVILAGVVWFGLWRLFSKIGKGVNKEAKKIKKAMEDGNNE